jgi:hypothetical protein
MPGLVAGIQPTACSGARFALDPGNKCRHDMEPLNHLVPGAAGYMLFALRT